MKKILDFVTVYKHINTFIPAESMIILASYSYIYNEISYKLLTYHTLKYYKLLQKKKLTGTEALARCAQLGVHQIIVDQYPFTDGNVKCWFEPAISGGDLNYRVFKIYGDHIIL